MQRRSFSVVLIITLAVCTMNVFWPGSAWGSSEKVLYAFQGGSDAAGPNGILTFKGTNIYSTTYSGAGGCPGNSGCGAVYELTHSKKGWTESLIYIFTGGSDGFGGDTGVIFDKLGNLYGATAQGGNPGCYQGAGCGAVFELSPSGSSWTEKTLYTFNDGDAGQVESPLQFDTSGNLYATGRWGHNSGCPNGYGCGGVLELSLVSGSWVANTLYDFTGGTDGGNPQTFKVLHGGGVYGVATHGGAFGDYGVVFELKHSKKTGWSESVLYSFSGSDGQYPEGGVVFDTSGNLYGTTRAGGAHGYGAVFELTPSGGGGWTETVLYSFTGGSDGAYPDSGVILDKSGNIYGCASGTTPVGGFYDYGSVFELQKSGSSYTERTLYTFTGGSDGGEPEAPLVLKGGNLYGTTYVGGAYGAGVVFEIIP